MNTMPPIRIEYSSYLARVVDLGRLARDLNGIVDEALTESARQAVEVTGRTFEGRKSEVSVARLIEVRDWYAEGAEHLAGMIHVEIAVPSGWWSTSRWRLMATAHGVVEKAVPEVGRTLVTVEVRPFEEDGFARVVYPVPPRGTARKRRIGGRAVRYLFRPAA